MFVLFAGNVGGVSDGWITTVPGACVCVCVCTCTHKVAYLHDMSQHGHAHILNPPYASRIRVFIYEIALSV